MRMMKHILLVLIGLLTTSTLYEPRPAFALFPGDCGKPSSSGLLGPNYLLPVATDAIEIGRHVLGVNSAPCTDRVCDVNSSGGASSPDDGVSLADMDLVLSKAIGVSVTLSCPACATSGTECVCTKTEIENLLDDDPTFTMLTRRVAGLFHCPTATTRSFSDAEWFTALYTIEADDVWFHGNNITITHDDGCSSPATCLDGDTTFMRFTGENQGISGFNVTAFGDGVHFAGTNGTAGNMHFYGMCDDAITNESAGAGTEVYDSLIEMGCDKCTQDEADASTVDDDTCVGRACYHNAYYNVDFDGCKIPMRFSSTAANGRFLISGGTHQPITSWPCEGSEAGASELEVTVEGVTVDGCDNGFVFGNGTHTVMGESQLINSADRGVQSKGAGTTAKVTVLDTKIAGTVGANASTPFGGGAVVSTGASAILDLGSSSDEGHNCIYNNKARPTGGAAVDREVANHVAGLDLEAQYNWWNNEGNPPASGELLKLCTDDSTQCFTNADCPINETCEGNSINTANELSSGEVPTFCQ